MCNLSKIEIENEELREENRKLKKEIEMERRIYLKWKTMAELFHDALWQALRKYDPEQYGEKRRRSNEKNKRIKGSIRSDPEGK